jgi:hypothetical protein
MQLMSFGVGQGSVLYDQFFRGLLLGCSVTVLSLIWLADPASAQPPTSCNDLWGKTNVEGTNATQLGNHEGLKSLMWIGTGANDCSRVSSLTVVTPEDGIVEWGWALGYLWGPADAGPCPSTTYHTTPVKFLFYQLSAGGAGHCTLWGAADNGASRTFSVADANGDTVWQFNYMGSGIGTIDLDFARGTLRTNSERHDDSDNAFADFDSLKFQVAGQSTWYDFATLKQYADTDPMPGFGAQNFNCLKGSNTHETVEVSARTCPLL